MFCPEYLSHLHIFICTPENVTMEVNIMSPCQTAHKGAYRLIRVHIICNIGYPSTLWRLEQMAIVVTGR